MKKKIINSTHRDIVLWIRQLKFKKKLFGGVDEEDVLKKIGELNSLYEKALLQEHARYDALLNASKGGDDGHEEQSETVSTQSSK